MVHGLAEKLELIDPKAERWPGRRFQIPEGVRQLGYAIGTPSLLASWAACDGPSAPRGRKHNASHIHKMEQDGLKPQGPGRQRKAEVTLTKMNSKDHKFPLQIIVSPGT